MPSVAVLERACTKPTVTSCTCAWSKYTSTMWSIASIHCIETTTTATASPMPALVSSERPGQRAI
jgi:hypothetical protein